MTMSETQSLDAMLEDAGETEAAPAAAAPPVEMGDKQSAAPPADAEPAPRDDAPHVPRKALEDERRKRQELERQIAEFQRGQQPPPQQQQRPETHNNQPVITQEDLERLWWENPAQAAAIIRNHAAAEAAQLAVRQTEVAMLSRDLERSKRRALKTHSQELIEAAEQEALKMRKEADFFDEDDPYEALVGWYNDVTAARDPQSLKERLRAELMAEMGISTPSSAPAKTKAPVPRSLASTASAQPRDDRGRYSGQTPLEDLIG